MGLYFKRIVATVIDFGIEIGGALLGGYFGAMLAALMIVLQDLPPAAIQKAMWTGMMFGFFFWGMTASLVNRVLVQGISRASFGKKLMNLEIVTKGAPLTWETMMKHWASVSLSGRVSVVSSLDRSGLAPVYSLHESRSVSVAVQESDSSHKKAA